MWRSLRTQATGTWDELRARLLAEHDSGGELEASDDGGLRLVFERASAPYPSTERYLAVAVAGADKQRARSRSRGSSSTAWSCRVSSTCSTPQRAPDRLT